MVISPSQLVTEVTTCSQSCRVYGVAWKFYRRVYDDIGLCTTQIRSVYQCNQELATNNGYCSRLGTLTCFFSPKTKPFGSSRVCSQKWPNCWESNTPFTRWSKHETNLEHTSCTCILNTFASCLLHVGYASSCKRGIS